MSNGLGQVRNPVKKVSDIILNNFLNNYRSVFEREINSVAHAMLISRSADQIEHSMFEMTDIPLYVFFDKKVKDGHVDLYCKVFREGSDNLVAIRKEADIRELEEYEGNRYINLFLHTVSDVDVASVFLP